jgi:hypothetical protein
LVHQLLRPADCRSEGRIDSGKLACAYHGWEFDSAGSCVRIPQIADRKAAAAATGSQRACLKMHPTREEQVRCCSALLTRPLAPPMPGMRPSFALPAMAGTSAL